MTDELPHVPEKGAAAADLRLTAHRLWLEAAGQAGVDLADFEPAAALSARIAWAQQHSLAVGVVYTRFSTKRQGSTEDQVRACVEYAARNGIYVPPEFLCIDEAVKGRRMQREGLDRAKRILGQKQATVLLFFKLSRLARLAHQAIRFLRETLVDEELRGISVTEGIDTADKRGWRIQTGLRGIMDEELLEIIGDHVREGLTGLFLKHWTTGALPVGYRPVEVPGGPPTRRNLPRTMPGIDAAAADLIRQHYRWVAEGMDLREGLRRWRASNGPVDPRSTSKGMSYGSYHRMLSREAYTGRWQFCRKRNRWSSKRDAIQQVRQPAAEVKTIACEELRIVDDDLFYRVQQMLGALKTGPRPRRTGRPHQLWDLAIGLFVCPHCQRRFHMVGAAGKYMHCPHPDCPAPAMVHRQNAVTALCRRLADLLAQDPALIDQIVAAANQVDEQPAGERDSQVAAKQAQIRSLMARIADLEELLGEGSEEDRQRRKGQIVAAQSQRAGLQLELAALQRQRGEGPTAPVTHPQVLAQVQDLIELLNSAANGQLGPDAVGKGLDIFRRLVGNRVEIHAQRRPDRKRWIIHGRFRPDLPGVLRERAGTVLTAPESPAEPIDVWLREPPFVDRIAAEVQGLYDQEHKGFRVINGLLEAKYGKPIGSGNCCAAYRRWYQIHGLPLPPRQTRCGRPRKNPAA